MQAYRENISPPMKFLQLVHQDVWGRMFDNNNASTANVSTVMAGKVVVTDRQGVFVTGSPVGKYWTVNTRHLRERWILSKEPAPTDMIAKVRTKPVTYCGECLG